MLHNFSKGELRDIAQHGVDGGFVGLTYTADTVDLFDAYGNEIWDMAYEDAENFGAKSVPEFVAGFRRTDMASSLDGFKNLMVCTPLSTLHRKLQGRSRSRTQPSGHSS